MEALWYLESLTNERLLAETGNTLLVEPAERIWDQELLLSWRLLRISGVRVVSPMGTMGFITQLLVEKPLCMKPFFIENVLCVTRKKNRVKLACDSILEKCINPYRDLRANAYQALHHPDDYQPSQQYASELKKQHSWGMVYHSVRHSGGRCIAILRPTAISIPIQGEHLSYVWNGEKISYVYLKGAMLLNFSDK